MPPKVSDEKPAAKSAKPAKAKDKAKAKAGIKPAEPNPTPDGNPAGGTGANIPANPDTPENEAPKPNPNPDTPENESPRVGRPVVDPLHDTAAAEPAAGKGEILVASNNPGTIDLGDGYSFHARLGKTVISDPEVIKRLRKHITARQANGDYSTFVVE